MYFFVHHQRSSHGIGSRQKGEKRNLCVRYDLSPMCRVAHLTIQSGIGSTSPAEFGTFRRMEHLQFEKGTNQKIRFTENCTSRLLSGITDPMMPAVLGYGALVTVQPP
jgi:hypothetical protein